MAGIIYAVILQTASKEDYNLTPLCSTVINLNYSLFFFLYATSLQTLTTIACDRLRAVSLHLRYQELVTFKRVTIVLISIWLTSCITALIYIFLSKSNEMAAAVILLVWWGTFWQQWHIFVFTKSSNITRIRYTLKISFKMQKQERHSDKGSPLIMLYLSILFF